MNEPQDNDLVDAIVVRVLERQVEPVIPADFAARVRRSLPAQTPHRQATRFAGPVVGPSGRLRSGATGFGTSIAILMAMLSVVAAFLLAGRAVIHLASLAFDMECALMLQSLAIAWWLATRRNDRSL
jgi:hypothetical protein